MAFFHANITQMQRQADSLREEAQRLRNIRYELQTCMQKLRAIDFLSRQKTALQKAYQQANEEYASLLLLVRGLESVIRLYQNNERNCENYTGAAGQGGNRFSPPYGSMASAGFAASAGFTVSGVSSASIPLASVSATVTLPRMLANWQPMQFWRNPYPWRQGASTGIIDIRKIHIQRCVMWKNNTILGLISIERHS